MEMNIVEIESRFRDIIADQLDVDPTLLTAGTRFREDLNADSLSLFELIAEIEDTFDIEVPQEDIKQITTFGEMLAYIHAYSQSSLVPNPQEEGRATT